MKNLPIFEIAEKLGIDERFVEPYGRDKAKISLEALKNPPRRGKLVLVSAITPTPAGEGKTTTSIGLAQGLKKSAKTRRSLCGNRRWDRFSGAKAARPAAGRAS